MLSNAKRRVREAEKRHERLHFKFIAEYVKCLHNNVYNEAEELYKNIRHEYPGVKDLTKTSEFMTVATPNKTVPRHYTSQRRENLRRSNKTQSSTDHTSSTDHMPQMVLEIPLMPLRPNTLSCVAVSPPVSPPVLPSVAVSPPVLPPVAVSPPVLPPVDASLPLPLSEDVYQDLLAELQHDPDLWRIINDFPLDDFSHEDSTIDMNDLHEDIWDEIIPNDVVPLEDELERVFDNIH